MQVINRSRPNFRVTVDRSPDLSNQYASAALNSGTPPTVSQRTDSPSPSLDFEMPEEVDDHSQDDDNFDFESCLPNPDSPSPADHFLDRLKELYTNFTDNNWNAFEELVHEFT